MLHTASHNEELAFFHPYVPIPEFDAQAAMDHQEQFVVMVVMMPDERPHHLHQLDVMPL